LNRKKSRPTDQWREDYVNSSWESAEGTHHADLFFQIPPTRHPGGRQLADTIGAENGKKCLMIHQERSLGGGGPTGKLIRNKRKSLLSKQKIGKTVPIGTLFGYQTRIDKNRLSMGVAKRRWQRSIIPAQITTVGTRCIFFTFIGQSPKRRFRRNRSLAFTQNRRIIQK